MQRSWNQKVLESLARKGATSSVCVHSQLLLPCLHAPAQCGEKLEEDYGIEYTLMQVWGLMSLENYQPYDFFGCSLQHCKS